MMGWDTWVFWMCHEIDECSQLAQSAVFLIEPNNDGKKGGLPVMVLSVGNVSGVVTELLGASGPRAGCRWSNAAAGVVQAPWSPLLLLCSLPPSASFLMWSWTWGAVGDG